MELSFNVSNFTENSEFYYIGIYTKIAEIDILNNP